MVDDKKKFTKPRNWPQVEIEGGPHAKNTKVTIDGKPVPALTRAVVTMDVNDAARIELHQYIDYAKLQVEGVIHHRVVLKGVLELPIEDENGNIQVYGELFEASGFTLVEALQNLVTAVEDDAAKELKH